MGNYLKLEDEIRKVIQINNVVTMLNWDIMTNMPIKAALSRQNEIITLTLIARQILTSDKVSDLLEATKDEVKQLNSWQLANIREIERRIIHTKHISDDLYNRYISSTTQCELVWRVTKQNDDFNRLKPYLQTVLDYIKEVAVIKAEKFNWTKYDALLDIYDQNRKTSEIKEIYAFLKKEIPTLIQKIINKQKEEIILPLTQQITIDTQRLICKRILEIVGFDIASGRLDESLHPVYRSTGYDVRLTTRYNENNVIAAIMATLHEVGHGLYEQNLPSNYKDQPVGKANSMALHESQSLFMEMQVGRSKEFVEVLAKLLRDEFKLQGQEYSSNNLYKLITRVKPNLIRVGSDEVTYLMHGLLRFELEDALINNELSLDELPFYWNKKMQEYLNIMPTTNKDGCMQDIQWPMGDFGYFPTYTCGTIMACMFMQKIKQLHPNINQEIFTGNLSSINQFLNKNIRNIGSSKSTDEIVRDVTGEPKINPAILLRYLEGKYLT